MRGQANENILTLMASIEGLHTQAADSDIRQTPHDNRTAQSPMGLDEPAMADHEVVQLNTIFASQPTGQEQRHKPSVSRHWSSPVSKDSGDDFDVKLAKLIDDVVGNDAAGERPAFGNRGAVPSGQHYNRQVEPRKTPYLDASRTENTRDIRSEIDFLLAPYLEKTDTAALSASPSGQRKEHREAKIQTIDRQIPPKAARKEQNPKAEIQQDTAPRPAIGSETINALLSPADLLELNDFIKQEIKKQISVWITQNIDKIIEDSLLSARSEARNATDSARETVNRSG